jgi:cell division protein ZapE
LLELNKEKGFLNFFTKKKPQRIYIHGDVGRGKTFLMDMLFEEINHGKKIRLHFHRFMQNLHESLKNYEGATDPLKKIVKDLSKRYECLCFDEFYVEDIADAMLLGKFMTELFKSDLSFFATSNIAPKNLYEDGLQRKLFLPAIKAIDSACEIYHLNSDVDFRLRALEKSGSYFYPADKNIEIVKKIFVEITQNKKAKEGFININNRKMDILAYSKGVLWANFLQICSSPRSAADYIEISKEFHTVILSDVPIINSDDEARRFISFIDECYDRRVKLIISAAELPEKLYVKSRLEEKFKRTISRMTEMQSKDYLSQAHLA